MKVNIVVVTLKSKLGYISQYGIPFSNKKEAKKFADKILQYYTKNTCFITKVTVQNAMPIREKVGKDWRKAGINVA